MGAVAPLCHVIFNSCSSYIHVMKGLLFLSGTQNVVCSVELLRAVHDYVTVVSWQVIKLV